MFDFFDERIEAVGSAGAEVLTKVKRIKEGINVKLQDFRGGFILEDGQQDDD